MTGRMVIVLVCTISVLLGSRHRLAVYMAEETLVILSVIAVGSIAVLFLQILFILLREGLRFGFRWLAEKSHGPGEFARRQLIHAKTLRSQSLGHELSKHGATGSRIHAPENTPRMFRWLR